MYNSKTQLHDKFGKWEVIELTTGPKLLCRCECGTEALVNRCNLRANKTVGCRKCADKDNQLSGNASWRGYKEIPMTYWTNLLANSTVKNRNVEITIEEAWELFIQQNRLCALSGIPLHFRQGKIKGTASLDRIDSSKGYIKGNIQWVHKTVNSMKTDLPQNEFIIFCTLIGKHNASKQN